MATITAAQVEASYHIASHVYDGKMTFEVGARELRDKHGLNINSARDFITNFRCMLGGDLFQRSLSAAATEYYLRRIESDRGATALANALAAIHKHLGYYEKTSGSNLKSIRAVIALFSVPELARVKLDEEERDFRAAVDRSLNDTDAARQARLLAAARKPVQIQAVVKVFRRNPDVVATVLARAKGTCEICSKPAPFNRKWNGEPYLEVHHKVQLAKGGDDTVENAHALCPNCHRQEHFGP